MSNPLVYNVAGKAIVNAFTGNMRNGFLNLYTGNQPALNAALTGTLLATMTFGAPSFGGATNAGGVTSASANAITSGTAGNSGASLYFALLESDGVTVVATGSVATENADMVMNTKSILAGNVVSCSAFTVSEQQT